MSRALLLLPALLALGCGTYSPLDSHFNKGVEYYDQGRLADAIREYKLAIEEGRENYRAHFNLGVCYHDQGKLDDAAREYEETLRRAPENARAMVSLASIRIEQKREAEALELLTKAGVADPSSGFPKSSLGAYYERKGDLDAALRSYRESVAIEPGHAAGRSGIARLLLKRGETAGGLAELDLALEGNPDDVALLLASSEARETKGDLKGATMHLERALVHVKDRAVLWIRLGTLYEKLDRLEDAVAALWQARAVEKTADVGPPLKALYTKLAARER